MQCMFYVDSTNFQLTIFNQVFHVIYLPNLIIWSQICSNITIHLHSLASGLMDQVTLSVSSCIDVQLLGKGAVASVSCSSTNERGEHLHTCTDQSKVELSSPLNVNLPTNLPNSLPSAAIAEEMILNKEHSKIRAILRM